MGYIYADTLAITTNGYWTERRVAFLDQMTITVVNKTFIAAVVKTRAT